MYVSEGPHQSDLSHPLAYLYELINNGLEVLNTSEHERVDTQAALRPPELISMFPKPFESEM